MPFAPDGSDLHMPLALSSLGDNAAQRADAATIEFLTLERTAIVDLAAGHVASHHYESAGIVEVRRRLEALFDRALESLGARDVSPIVAYAAQIAQERFEAGYDLSQVQGAFNALETVTWTRVLATLPPDRLARTLGLVSTILGAGKDTLARAYVGRATGAQTPSLDFRALFAGTDGI